MKVEELFLYSGMMHVFAFNYDIGPKRLTFQLQLLDHRKKQNASFRDRPTIYSGAKFRKTFEKRATKRNSIEKISEEVDCMAIIENENLFFELFPKKYSEKDEDPFISSTLGIGIDGKGVFHFYGELLMKSEFEYLLSNVRMMLHSKIDNFMFIPVEPIFKMQVIKETATLYCWIFKFQTGKPREHRFYTSETEVRTFYLQLKEEMNNVLPPPFLPK